MIVDLVIAVVAVLKKVIYHQFYSFYYYTNNPTKLKTVLFSLLLLLSEYVDRQQQQLRLNPLSMESSLSDVLAELQAALEKAKQLEARYLGEILALERIVNHSLKTVPQLAKKQIPKPQEIKPLFSKEQVESKVDAFLNEIDLKQKYLETDQKPKQEVKLPEVVIEKKPPVPTANRIEKTVKNFTPAYIPPRNKNEVTGKVTQTTIRASNQKVFKPDLTGTKRSASREVINDKGSFNRSRQSIQAKPDKKQEKKELPQLNKKVEEKVSQPIPKQQKVSNSTAKSVNQIRQDDAEERPNRRLQSFKKDSEQLLGEIIGKGNKNRRSILQKMIKDYQNQEIGYKKNEQASRTTFIRRVHNYSLSRNHVHPIITHKIYREKWQYYPELFQLASLLQRLQHELAAIGNIKEYRLDPKQQYKLVQTASKLSQIFEQIDQAKGVVPDQLNLSFSYVPVATPSNNQQEDLHVLSEVQLNESFLKMLEQISSSNTLERGQLRGLQVLGEVGVFKCKKSPILVVQDEYEQWRGHYFSQTH